MKKFLLSLLIVVINCANGFSQNTCASAIPLTQAMIPYSSASLTTCGTGNDYGVGAGACNTTYGGGEDYVFSLNITSSPVTYSFSLGGAGTWKICQVYTGCPSPAGAPTNCLANFVTGGSPTGGANITFPSNGTYYIVIDSWPAPACVAFTLGITPGPTCPGSLGTGVTSIASLPYTGGASTTCGQVNDITSTNVGAICGSSSYYGGEDVVYSFTPTATGYVNINLNTTGSWTGLTLYKGCPFSSTTSCVGYAQSSTANQAISACVSAGSVYYAIIDSWPSPTCNPISSFTISSPTASSTTNDFCGTPTPISMGGSYTGSTNVMTADQPGNLASVFCGSIENNQWFSFVASASTATFGFSNIGGASCPYGVQGQVFNTVMTPTPCVACTNFTSMSSPCYNPGTLANGTLTATGLTVGQTYYLMVDGNAGSQCTFSISGWSIPVLPVDLIYFKGKGISSNSNKLEWMVAQEKDLYGYVIQRSVDGKNFSDLDVIGAAGNVHSEKTYSYYDKSFKESVNYYRLKIIDLDGTFRYSSLVAINSNPNRELTINKIFPNPANTEVYMSVDVPTDAILDCEVVDVTGRVVLKSSQPMSMGTGLISLNLEKLNKGIYYLKFICDGDTKIEKFSLQ